MKTKLFIYSIRIAVVVGLVMLMLSFSGCRMTKQATKTNTETALNADLTANQTNASALDIESKLSKMEATNNAIVSTDNSIVDETIEENSTKNTFSPPDSTGMQYLTSQTNTNKKIHRGKQNALKTAAETKAKAETTTQKNDKSDYKSEASVKDKSKSTDKTKVDDKKTTETQTPGFVSCSMILLVLGLLGLTYLVLKRLNAVK